MSIKEKMVECIHKLKKKSAKFVKFIDKIYIYSYLSYIIKILSWGFPTAYT